MADISRNMACNMVHAQLIHKQEFLAILSSQIFPIKAVAANFQNGHHIFHISAVQRYSDTSMKPCTQLGYILIKNDLIKRKSICMQ